MGGKSVRILVLVVVMGLGIGTLPVTAGADVLSGAAASTLRREPQLSPAKLGNNTLDGVQYGDPTEGIDVVQPPEPNNQGSAELSLPLSIPPGRGGVQPDLTLHYDSSGESTWLGTGWDLNVGEITVDTEFGVPRYDHDRETETYLLDGDRLSPNAITGEPEARDKTKDRADFTRQVDDHYDLIIRHGTDPTNYWWEVRDKMGGIKWYGGKPDQGGPTGGKSLNNGTYVAGEGSFDGDAVLRDDSGNIYRWALSAQRDVGVNMMRYFYTTDYGLPVGSSGDGIGKEMYLSRVQYTATANVGGRDHDPLEDPEYEVTFIRDREGDLRRHDVKVSGRGGFIEVSADLLRRIEVKYGDPNLCRDATEDSPHCDNHRTYDHLAKAFNFNYNVEGPYGKALLTSVDQVGSDGNVYATNRFDYFDDVNYSGDRYDGFSGAGWHTPSDGLGADILSNTMGASALGSSQSLEIDGHAYLGFAPFDPEKDGSIGGSITIKGGVTEATAELIDLNGDQLPDKIWRDGTDIKFRLNKGGPDGEHRFDDDDHTAGGISTLSSEWNIGVGGAVEAYAGASVAFSVAGDLDVGEDYFTDANADGLPDLVHAGHVRFNHLGADGVPSFSESSAGTDVPITSSQLQMPDLPKLKEIEEQQKAQSPLQDTVRRWIAPFKGTVSIDAPVTLDPQPDPLRPDEPYDGDGVRVTIEHGRDTLWAGRLQTPGQVATPTAVGAIPVTPGDAIYFRLQSVDDGRRDQVKWDPVVQYVGRSEDLDVNGMDYWKYTASKEYTLGGRAGISVGMPLDGHVKIAGTVHKARPTTDDVTVLAVLHKQDGTSVPRIGPSIAATATGDFPVSIEFDVHRPNDKKFDSIALKLAVDTPIDVSGLSWTSEDGKAGPPMFYTSATKPDGTAIQTQVKGEYIIQLHPLYDVDLYSASDKSGPQPAPVLFPDNGNANHNETAPVDNISAKVIAPALIDRSLLPQTLVFSVKDRSGYVCKGTVIIPRSDLALNEQPRDIVSPEYNCPTFRAKEGERYWFDFTTPDARMAQVGLRFVVHGVADDDAALHWPRVSTDPDNIDVFPEAFRGWAFAGYNGDGDLANQSIDPSAFQIHKDDYPQGDDQRPKSIKDAQPDGNTGYKNPTHGRSYPYVPFFLQLRDLKTGKVVSMDPAWRGLKDNTVGGAGFVRSSRTAADDPNLTRLAGVGAAGDSVSAVRRIGVTGPTLSAAVGALVVGAGVTVGPSWGLLDYVDMNGDGFPDVVGPDYIRYTGPRGAYYNGSKGSGGGNGTAQDLTVGVNIGFDGSVGKVNGNAQGDVNTSQETSKTGTAAKTKSSSAAADDGDDATDKEYGFNIGAAFDGDFSFTNPSGVGSAADAINEATSELGLDGAADYEKELDDLNGDGLPDQVRVNASGVYVKLNTGYGFASEVKWASGGFETGTSAGLSADLGVGFEIFHRGFSGGLGVSQDANYPIYSWADVNGDDILDRLHKDGDDVKVAFGTGNGLGDEVNYGDFEGGHINLLGDLGIPTTEMAAMDESRGLGAGFDISIPIGPLCPPEFCWIIVNPGVHVDTSWSSTRVQVADINGDGYADSLASSADDNLDVKLNNHGRTNLLKSVHNPLGGSVNLDYTRAGNTVEQPNSVWNLTKVEVDDGRPGDGVDKQLTTYEYANNRYNRLDRAILGYDTVVERQLADQNDPNPYDDPVLRKIERHYRNATIFDNGLLTDEVLKTPGDKALKETVTEWKLVELKDLAAGKPADVGHRDDDPADLRFFGMSVARERTKVEQRWYDGNGNLGESTWTTFDYDDLGNVTKQVDKGEPENPDDDVTSITTWSSCQDSASKALKVPFPCPATPGTGTPPATAHLSPLWNDSRCPTWTSIPATFKVIDSKGNVLRERNGAKALCDNSSVTQLLERTGGDQWALTELDYDKWGSYDHIVYPPNADNERVRIDYVYDDEAGHANVAKTTRSLCMTPIDELKRPADERKDDPCVQTEPPTGDLEVASATFDSPSGRIASRTDANGQTTTYRYDSFGRITDIRAPFERATEKPTAHLEYSAPGADYAWATASNFDAFHPGNTIDTVTFADGLGRQTQTKQDATVFRGANAAAADVRIVSGAIEFDALGRVVNEWYPTEESLTVPLTRHSTAKPPNVGPTSTTWNLLDSPTDVKYPDDTHESTTYGFGGLADFGATLFMNTFTDRNGKPEVTYSDVHENVIDFDDAPKGQPAIRTRYRYDGLGQLAEVVDNGGNKTNHTYDMLGRLTSTRTPDGGLVERTWDEASNLVVEVDPNMRAAGVRTTYHYHGDRLVSIDYPPGTPDVTYTWGVSAARGDDHGNGTGRVIAVTDGARDEQVAYDKMGNVARETSTMLVHNLNDSIGQRLTYTTTFDYDTFGRLKGLVYPDGEVLSNDYDSGGLLKTVSGRKAGLAYGYVDRLEYDEFSNRRFEKTANGVQTEYTYDALTRRLSRLLSNAPTREIQDLNYSYDNIGNVLKLDNQLPPAVPELKGGPSVQTYTYDPYYRLKSANGTYSGAPDKIRTYSFSTSYDVNGNITAKSQNDQINKITQKPTTYDLKETYRSDKEHQLAKIGSQTYKYDPNGNFTGWTDDKSGTSRTVTWDATDRVRSVADQGSTTTYAYDEAGRLGIERGPSGEAAFVNQWYTVVNGSVAWKNIWAGDDRVASQRAMNDGTYELFRYFLHKDLQGSTNIVTDDEGLVWQHFEYFPSGEQWVVEQGDDNRTPYGYTGSYYDEVRKLDDLGARWYEPREQFLYSPDPVLQDDPNQVIDNDALLPAYSYAESNPLRLVDLDGRRSSKVQAELKAFALSLQKEAPPGESFQDFIKAMVNGVDVAPEAAPAPTEAELKHQAKLEKWGARKSKFNKVKELLGEKGLIEINYKKTDDGFKFENVKLSPTFGLKQFTVKEGKAAKTKTKTHTNTTGGKGQ